MNEINRSISLASGWHLYDIATAMTTAVPREKAERFKRGFHGIVLPDVVHPKGVPRYVETFG